MRPSTPFLKHALHFVVEAGEAVERFLERQEVVEHRLRPVVPALARNDDADAGRVDQRERRGDAALDLRPAARSPRRWPTSAS